MRVGGSCNNVKHKCESYESLVYGCSQCEFVRNDDGIIIGCKCSQFVGACLHKIEECSNPEKSATDYTHENAEFINLNQYLNQKL